MTGRNDRLETLLKSDPEWVERRSAERQPVDNFSAYRWNGFRLTQEAVKDISSTGLYISTEERWPPGTLLSLTLQREGSLETNPERRIEVQARVVRCGEDGVGLAFVFKDDPESRQWESFRENLIEQVKPGDMLSLVMMVEAVAFLSRICPGGADEVGQLVQGRLSNHKLANAVEIALKAENLLVDEPVADKLRADGPGGAHSGRRIMYRRRVAARLLERPLGHVMCTRCKRRIESGLRGIILQTHDLPSPHIDRDMYQSN